MSDRAERMIPAFATIWKMSASYHRMLEVWSPTTCKPPRVWIVSLTIFFTSLSWDTSAVCIYARLPLVEISRCSASSADIWEDKSARAMSKPSLERRRAIACPMPLEAPVTIATPNVISNEWGNIREVPLVSCETPFMLIIRETESAWSGPHSGQSSIWHQNCQMSNGVTMFDVKWSVSTVPHINIYYPTCQYILCHILQGFHPCLQYRL